MKAYVQQLTLYFAYFTTKIFYKFLKFIKDIRSEIVFLLTFMRHFFETLFNCESCLFTFVSTF